MTAVVTPVALVAPVATYAPAVRRTSPPRSRRAVSWQRASDRRRSVVVRRRVVAALIVALVLVGGAVRAVAVGSAGPASSVARRPAVHVVQPGETIWSIARQYRPTGDVRGLVRQLVERNGGPDVEVGQELVLSG